MALQMVGTPLPALSSRYPKAFPTETAHGKVSRPAAMMTLRLLLAHAVRAGKRDSWCFSIGIAPLERGNTHARIAQSTTRFPKSLARLRGLAQCNRSPDIRTPPRSSMNRAHEGH